MCEACPEGKFSQDNNMAKCTVCAVGQSQNNAGRDRCKQCAMGTYAAATSSLYCEACTAGQHQDARGQATCKACAEGKYQNSRDGAPDCKTLARCVPGTYVSLAPTASSNRECASCAAGKFTSQDNKLECKNCAIGTYQNNRNGAFCHECMAGAYADVSISTSSSQHCKGCPTGMFSSNLAQVVSGCQLWTQCNNETQWLKRVATEVNDRICSDLTICEGDSLPIEPARNTEFQALANRKCTQMSQCTDTQYEAVTPVP
jgi:hypothetical protein